MDVDFKNIDKHVYERFSNALSTIDNFCNNHKTFTYIEFDYYTANELTLFYVDPNFDFDLLKDIIEQIRNVIPSMKRIFSKPIIALEDIPEVLPVEVVQKIDQNTLQYLGSHFHTAENVINGRVKPRKLYTRIYQDQYSIYENIVFVNFVDEVLRYCRRNIRILQELITTSDIMQLNLLERLNHNNYFLALGKLHTSYKRDFEQYLDISKELFDEIDSILSSVRPYLKRPVYQKTKLDKKKVKLKKTNIFINQKDYRKIYNTYKSFIKNRVIEAEKVDEVDYAALDKNYLHFAELLLIFAAGHFNFKCKTNAALNLDTLNIHFQFKDWTLYIKRIPNDGIMLKIRKDKDYNVLLLPSLQFTDDELLAKHKRSKLFDEVIILEPVYVYDKMCKRTFVSMEDIESFKRLQQIILRGMIYSDTTHQECPFCHAKLKKDEMGDYYCDRCRLEIKEATCPNTNKNYFYTTVKDFDIHNKGRFRNYYFKWNEVNQREGTLFYRNITKLNRENKVICPKCGEIHKTEVK